MTKPTPYLINRHLRQAYRFYAAGKTGQAVQEIKLGFRMAQDLQALNTKEYADKQSAVLAQMEQINALTHAMVLGKRKSEAAKQGVEYVDVPLVHPEPGDLDGLPVLNGGDDANNR